MEKYLEIKQAFEENNNHEKALQMSKYKDRMNKLSIREASKYI